MGQIAIFISFLFGITVGIWGNPLALQTASLLSTIFMNLLKLVSLPLLFLSVVSTLSGMESSGKLKEMGRRVVGYTLLTTTIAATVALLLFLLIDPASGAPIAGAAPEVIEGGYLDYLLEAIPSGVLQPFLEGNVLGVLFLALLLSAAILSLPKEQRNFLHRFFSSLFAAVMQVTSGLVKLLPFIVWAFVALCFEQLEGATGLGRYLMVVVGANFVQALVVLPLLLLLKGISPLRAARAMFPALTVAFFAKSSSAAMPTAMQCAEEKLKLSPSVVRFSFPLCITINMNACAGFILTTVLFVSASNGLTFSPIELVGWIFIATIAAVGNASVPMGCYFLSSALLAAMGVPLNLLGAILPFYTLLDMLETAINVWSDSCVAAIVDKEIEEHSHAPLETKLQPA